jgi:hypothetical protein
LIGSVPDPAYKFEADSDWGSGSGFLLNSDPDAYPGTKMIRIFGYCVVDPDTESIFFYFCSGISMRYPG